MRFLLQLCILLISTFYCITIHAQEPTSDTINAEEDTSAEENSKDKLWKADSITILDMVSELRSNALSNTDSTIQKEEKSNKIAQLHQQINNKYKGQKLSLNVVFVEDVKPERVLSAYGKKKAKKIIDQIRKSPEFSILTDSDDVFDNPFVLAALSISLGNDPECYKETGRYLVTYIIPVSHDDSDYNNYNQGIFVDDDQTIPVTITRIEKSKEKALKINKGPLFNFCGKINSILYTSSTYTEQIEITIE